jgi:hypothetical protein
LRRRCREGFTKPAMMSKDGVWRSGGSAWVLHVSAGRRDNMEGSVEYEKARRMKGSTNPLPMSVRRRLPSLGRGMPVMTSTQWGRPP